MISSSDSGAAHMASGTTRSRRTVAPGLPSMHNQDGSVAMSESQIQEIIDGFVQAAVRAKKAGLDGCELMAA